MIKKLAAFMVNRMYYPNSAERIVACEDAIKELTEKLNECIDRLNDTRG